MWEDHEGTIRLAVFVGVLMAMGLWEAFSPKRTRLQTRHRRWFSNISLVVVDTVLLRVLIPGLAIGVAAFAQSKGWGLFGVLNVPMGVEVILGVLLLDLAIYGQHVASHHVPIFWRVHRMHHADRDIDVTTALRFHPIEIILSMLYKMALVVVLGVGPFTVFLFEVILNASAMFNHGNVRLPQSADRVMRSVIVTPDMHRVHHSVIPGETNSNYGFCLSVWDRVFKTYKPQPEKGHDSMTIGLQDFQTERPAHLLWCLWLPFLPNRRTKCED